MEETDRAHQIDRLQEGVTMALYISISLLAVLLALPRNLESVAEHPAELVVVTGIGLIVAHLAAFTLASRMVSAGKLTTRARDLVGAQLTGGLAVTAIALVPLLILDGYNAIVAAELVLLALVVAVGYRVARLAQLSRVRTALYIGGVVVIVLAVLWLKGLGAH